MTDEIQKIDPDAQALAALDYGQFDGTGFENVAEEKDLRPPFMAILQTNSKPCLEGHAKYVRGARAGMFLNTGTGELFEGAKGFAIVPLRIDHCVVEWEGDPGSGKFVQRHAIDSQIYLDAMDRFEKSTDPNKKLSKHVKAPNGNTLQNTYYLWALMLDESGEAPIGAVVLPFKSTNISIYTNQVKNRLYTFKGTPGQKRPPLFAHRLRCYLAREDRPAGSSYNYRFEPLKGSIVGSLIDSRSPLMAAAYEVFKLIQEGKAKLDEEQHQDAGDDGAARETSDEAFA